MTTLEAISATAAAYKKAQGQCSGREVMIAWLSAAALVGLSESLAGHH